MSIVVLLPILIAAATLAWPVRHPIGGDVGGVGGQGASSGPTGPSGPGDQGNVGDDPVPDGAFGGMSGRDAGTPTGPVPVVDVASVIDLLALVLRGGVGLIEAMEAVAARVGGPLGLHLRTVAAARRWGVDDSTAWASVPQAWQPAARALRMASTSGVPPADVLARAAEQVRRAEDQRLDVATATLGVRIVLPLGLAFLPAFVLTTVAPIVLALAHQVLVSQ